MLVLGTEDVGDGLGVSELSSKSSLEGGIPFNKSLTSSNVKVSYSINPFATVCKSSIFSVKIFLHFVFAFVLVL